MKCLNIKEVRQVSGGLEGTVEIPTVVMGISSLALLAYSALFSSSPKTYKTPIYGPNNEMYGYQIHGYEEI